MSDREFVALDGKHPARGKSWTFDQQNGKFIIKVICEITDGLYRGHTVLWRGYFTDAAGDRTLESLRYLGWEGDDLATIDNLDRNDVEIDVISESYPHRETGETVWVNKVNWVNKPSRLTPLNPINQNALQAFAADMKGKVLASRAKMKGAAAAPSARRPGGYSQPSRVAAPSQRQVPAHLQPDDGYGSGDPGPSDADVGF